MALSFRRDLTQAVLLEGDPLPPGDRALASEPVPVEDIYRQEGPRLLRLLRNCTTSDNVGDLVQRVFARFIGLGSERRARIAEPAAYLYRMGTNLALDDAKSDARRAAILHVPAEEIELVSADPVAGLEARDTLRRLERSLLRLKPRTREIFLAHRIDGFSYVEIAERTGLSVKGVEKHMSQAIAFIDRVLTER